MNARVPAFGFLAACAALIVTSCSGPNATIPFSSSYNLTVAITATDTLGSLKGRFGGDVIVWRPEANFAIVRTAKPPALKDLTVEGVDANDRAVSAPVAIPAKGANVWMGGWTSWSGGWTSWSGGWTSWSGGSAIPALPAENSAAWNLIRLPQAQASSSNYGEGVKVAVIDTGIDLQHPMFQGRLAPADEWKDFVDDDAIPQEVGTPSDPAYGHGTGVAGIILQVAPRITILPLRVLEPSGAGDLDKVVEAIDWAIAKGARVVNLSLGADQNQTSLTKVLEYAASKGVYVVASAGNEAKQDGVTFPAALSHQESINGFVLGIGSTDAQDVLSSFSNYGTSLYGTAPGEGLYSAYPANRVARFTGTSFAAPIYAGAIALGLKELPAGGDERRFSRYIANGSRPDSISKTPSTSWVGAGRINVERLIRNLPNWQPKAPYGAVNFVVNGSFDQGFTDWQLGRYEPDTPVDGEQPPLAQLVQDAGHVVAQLNPGNVIVQQLTGLQPNTSYTLSASLRNANPSEGVWLSVVGFDNAEQDMRSLDLEAYSRHFLTFTTGPNGTTGLVLVVNPRISKKASFAYDVQVHQTGY